MAPLEIRTFPGAGGGMDLASPVHMLADSKARWIVDGLVDRSGLVRQRGKIDGTAIEAGYPEGIMATFDITGNLVEAVVLSDGPGGTNAWIRFLDVNHGLLGTYALTGNWQYAEPNLFSSTSFVRNNGTIFGSFGSYIVPSTTALRALGMWRGGTKANYTTGTATVLQGTTTLTGIGTTWSTNVTPGMFLLQNMGAGLYKQIGVVRSVNTDTSITLETPALFAMSANNYLLTSIRGINPRMGVGRLAATSTGSQIVTGAGTKFQQLTSAYSLFRLNDMAPIGDVQTVQSNTSLTLAANAGLNIGAPEKYVALQRDFAHSVQNPQMGIIVETHQGRVFYANASYANSPQGYISRVWYTDPDDAEVFDLTADGWSFDIPSTGNFDTPIVGMASTEAALVVFKETETYGIFGNINDPTSLSVKRIADVGCICLNSIVQNENGVIWASDNGIYQFDGTEVKNLTQDSLGDFWTQTFVNFNPEDNISRVWAMIERDHYFLSLEAGTQIPYGWYKGSTEVKPNRIAFVLNLLTGAVTLATNLGLRGAVPISAAGTQEAGNRYLVMRQSTGFTYVCKGRWLFLDSDTPHGGTDAFQCVGHPSVSPSFYFESARYDMDDPQIKKLWKQVQILHTVKDLPLYLDVVTNFADNGTTTAGALPIATTWTNRRLKFLKRSQLLGFRIYSVAGADTTVPTNIQLGPWAIGFKRQRPGRV